MHFQKFRFSGECLEFHVGPWLKEALRRVQHLEMFPNTDCTRENVALCTFNTYRLPRVDVS